MKKDEIDGLKNRLDCRDIAERLLSGRGKRFWCPACQTSVGKTPDLSVKKQSFICYKCGWSGDVIELVMGCTGYDFQRTIEYLGGDIGFTNNVRPYRSTSPTVSSNVCLKERSTIYSAFLAGCRQVEGKVLSYLTERGIGIEIIEHLKLRFCGQEYGSLIKSLETRFGKEKLLSVGLMAEGKKGPYPTFWPYYAAKIGFLVIPYIQAGQPVYLKARPPINKTIANGNRIIRFLNTAGIVPCLYNIDILSNADMLEDADTDQVLICEGETDTMTALTYDYVAVGIPGWGHFKAEWAELFRGKATFLVLDSDAAGDRGINDIAVKFQQAGLPIPKHVLLPTGQDLNEYINDLIKD